MAFFTVKKDEKSVADNSFEYINESGIYDVTIKFVSVKVNTHNARSLDFNVLYKGAETTLYGLKLENNDGTDNYQRALFNKLCVIADLESIDEPVIRSHKVGKDQKEQEFSVLEQFDDLPIKIGIRFNYSRYNGEIREQREIIGFYRASDGATANEITNGLTPGARLEKDRKFEKNVKYSDGLTEDEVREWKASKSNSTTAKTTSAPTKKAEDDPF